MATSSSRSNSNSAAKIVGPKAAKMGGGNINPRGEVGRPGDPGGHMWPKAAAKTSPNPANPLRMKENFLSSISRAGQAGTGPSGKARDSRIIKATGVKPEALDNANTVKVNSNPVPNRTSPSLSQPGRLGGAHAGGQGISEEEMFAGKGPSKLGGLGALGSRIARATEGEVPLP